MAGKNEKWELFRNFMYNELHVTKEDIHQWIRDACREQAELLVKQTFNTFDIKQMVKDAVLKNFSCGIKRQLVELLVEKINIEVKDESK